MRCEEHSGFPDDYAYWPAMPYKMHTPGPRQTLPSTLGPGAVPRARSTMRSALDSTLRPHPSARSRGAGPPRPCGLSCDSPQHCPYHSPDTHMPLPLPLSLAQPPLSPLPVPQPCPCTRLDQRVDQIYVTNGHLYQCPASFSKHGAGGGAPGAVFGK